MSSYGYFGLIVHDDVEFILILLQYNVKWRWTSKGKEKQHGAIIHLS